MSARRRARAAPVTLIVTCEHGGNRIPAEYRPLFRGFEDVLASHRGYDPGALSLARELAVATDAPLVAATVSRLLIELNRSPGHRALYSDRTRDLPQEEKARILARYYEPYRREVEDRVRSLTARRRRVVHISSHSFTPVLHGEVRRTDIGLLYDPRRGPESIFCREWAALLGARIAPLRVRRNYPYRGYADGLTTYLRRQFAQGAYLGIEIEVNQKHPLQGGKAWRMLRREIVRSVVDLLQFERTAP